MAALTPAQITVYAANAGFTGADLQTAVAIAMAESSGNPAIIGDSGNSYGLWQINLPAHPNFRGANLLDPQTNANAAYSVYQAAGGSFQPWTTYNTGAYQAYMPASAPASGIPPVIDVGGTPAAAPASAGVLGNIPTSSILLLTGIAVGVFLLSDLLSDD